MRPPSIPKRRKTRKPPSKLALWLMALMSVLGFALMLVTQAGVLRALAVGMFGGFVGSWLASRKLREDARREGRLD
jgi:uncharacterized membrane protein YsdA (DUF1294 family)